MDGMAAICGDFQSCLENEIKDTQVEVMIFLEGGVRLVYER